MIIFLDFFINIISYTIVNIIKTEKIPPDKVEVKQDKFIKKIRQHAGKLGALTALAGFGALATTNAGCESCSNSIAAQGGFFGTYAGDYIAVSQSGGEIMDVYKLRNVYVEPITNSDGWRFKDQDGNMVFLGGDVKLIRLSEDDPKEKNATWDRFHEYHMESATKSYREMYGALPFQGVEKK